MILEPYLDLGRTQTQRVRELFPLGCRKVPLLAKAALEFADLRLAEQNTSSASAGRRRSGRGRCITGVADRRTFDQVPIDHLCRCRRLYGTVCISLYWSQLGFLPLVVRRTGFDCSEIVTVCHSRRMTGILER